MKSLTDTVILLDVSLSMGKGYGDLRPSKLDSSKEAILLLASRLLENPSNRIGIVVFFGQSLPILPLTNDKGKVVRSIYRINFTEEGSAPGNGIIDSVKMLRRTREGRSKGIVLITDGDINLGVPIEAALLYASNSNVYIYTITIGERPKTEEIYRKGMERYGWTYRHAASKSQLYSAVIGYVNGGMKENASNSS